MRYCRLSLAASLATLLFTGSSKAQDPVVHAVFGLGSGLEAADTGNGWLEWQRARLRVSTGFDYGNSETPWEQWSVRGLADLERSILLGGELRYVRWLGGIFGAYGAATAMVTPETLAGLGVGAILNIPLGPVGLMLEGSFSALPVGTDRVDGGMVLWALANAGVRLRL